MLSRRGAAFSHRVQSAIAEMAKAVLPSLDMSDEGSLNSPMAPANASKTNARADACADKDSCLLMLLFQVFSCDVVAAL